MPQKIALADLQEKARLITLKELEKYVFPDELYQYMGLDILFDNKQENVFVLHIPGQSGKLSITISKTRMNIYTGEGLVEYIGLDPLNLKPARTVYNKVEYNQNILGDIIAIPTQNKQYIPAQIVYVSEIFDHQILLGIYGNPTHFLNKIPLPPEIPNQFLKLIYTSLDPIKNEQWPTIEVKNNKLSSQTLARRIIGDELWLNDTHIRSATAFDKDTFDIIDVKANHEVENILNRLFELK